MKLGIVFNIFNGDELLEDSLVRLRHLADYIVLMYLILGIPLKGILIHHFKDSPHLFMMKWFYLSQI